MRLRALAVLALCAALVSCAREVARGPAPRTTVVVGLFSVVARDLRVMAASAYDHKTERIRCVTRWKERALGDTLYVLPLTLGPAEVESADSLSINVYPTRTRFDTAFTRKVCGDTLPVIHTHDLRFGIAFPSDVDSASAKRSRAPFHFVVVIEDAGATVSVIPYRASR